MPELSPQGDEIVVTKTTDSALTGTNLRLMLRNIGITDVIVSGIFTDQCVSSTVRSLADESFGVVVVHDACAAATMDLHEKELEIINMIYCHVVGMDDLSKAIARCLVLRSLILNGLDHSPCWKAKLLWSQAPVQESARQEPWQWPATVRSWL